MVDDSTSDCAVLDAFGRWVGPHAAALLIGILACIDLGCAQTPPQARTVRPGIEMLISDSTHLVSGRRVGLLTNQTGVDSRGVGDVEVLLDANIELTAIFSPEHGFRGNLDSEDIGNVTDSATGLPIFSLYGERRAPSPEMLELIDVLLVDLQDIGARTYTYISAALKAMEAAAAVRVPVVILDRPNPIGGLLVQGPVLDLAFSTYVGMLPVPLRHGMTLGELALFGNAELEIGADLVVIPAGGWQRSVWFDETGMPWVRPSPNMPDLESASHYPGMVLFEGTNISVGRGTPIAFQVVGAPWLDLSELLPRLANEPGVLVYDTTFTPLNPADRKYGGQLLPALRFRVSDRDLYDPTRLAARTFAAIRDVHPDSLRLTAGLDRLAGSAVFKSWIDSGRDYEILVRSWEAELAEFRQAMDPFLLYR